MNYLMLVLVALGAARATYLVTDDNLPFGYLRAWLVKSPNNKAVSKWTRADRFRLWLVEGLQCTHCVSVHTGFWAAVLSDYAGWIPVHGWASGWPTFAVTWWAISGAVVLLELIHFRLLGDH